MKKKILSIVSVLLIATILVGCGPTETPTQPTEVETIEEPTQPVEITTEETPTEAVEVTEPITATFWTAPNPTQTVFWQSMAEAYMAAQANIKIDVSAMAETPTSEATILTSIAGGTAPAASENVFIGFGQQLVNSEALVPLDTMPGWEDLIKNRHMEQTIEGWKFADGHYYVLPIYSNAMLMGWRIDILKELGYDTPPRTYSEIYEMGEKLKAKYPDKVVWARPALAENTWWERWFDFFMLYYAASNGTPIVSGTDITADDASAINVLSFMSELSKKGLLLTQQVTDPFETGVEVMDSLGPWVFAGWKEKYPELHLNENYVLTPPPVPDDYPADQPIKTFADAKGIVLYKQEDAKTTEAVWEFIKWVFSDPQNDLTWLEKTTLPPARDDLATNEAFQSFFEENPQLKAYAEESPYAVPPMAVEKFTEIQTELGDVAIVPVVTSGQDPTQAWEAFKASLERLIK